mgnify:CR=1 FL=1|tara:strand:+ start:61337 stop:62974 length:1638 start_codon:yes stop_codon:yes gene_type:complete
MPNPHDTYTSPLASRNASPEMCRIWSPRHKFTTWRKIWLAVAEAQQACGLDISDEQLDEMRSTLEVTDEDMELAAKYERELRHDVMAHVHAWGDRCPKARPIIHLGCTSQDVVCNADLLCLGQSIGLIQSKCARVIVALSEEAEQRINIPTLGFTHYQAAQPTTVGRRLAGYAYDIWYAMQRLRPPHNGMDFLLRGFRGATGTQASFLQLFQGDHDRVERFQGEAVFRLRKMFGMESSGSFRDWIEKQEEMDQRSDDLFSKELQGIVEDVLELPEGELALPRSNTPPLDVYIQQTTYALTGQTYPRVFDSMVLADLASVASVLHKIATDIRLLSNRKEIDEPFGKSQIGSSAMPYKRNPMKCERICGLTRFVMNLVGNAYDTAATQWLERTLDDSSNRRLSLPEAFLALDGALDLMHTVASGLIVNEAMVKRNLMAELPFMATENIMMEAVKLGRDRQDVHEAIRVLSHEAGYAVKQEGKDNDLLERLKKEPLLEGVDIDAHLDPMQYVGRSVEQTERFIKEVVEPLRERYGDQLEALGSADRGV